MQNVTNKSGDEVKEFTNWQKVDLAEFGGRPTGPIFLGNGPAYSWAKQCHATVYFRSSVKLNALTLPTIVTACG